MANKDRCEKCLFWDSSRSAHASEEITGACRRNPPGFDSRTLLAVWPFTEETDWCAEYRLDPKAADEDDEEDESHG